MASSSGPRYRSAESVAELRSTVQIDNGKPSTSSPYWDTEEEDDGGPKPSDLYGKYTWKIEKFSEINTRELRSDVFDIGGIKWYIVIYPNGCDVCNHLSLFVCVANPDKLSPGWSHYALFTVAVVNKEPKKSKYSDALHRFWKKEHDWGWQKFIETPKLREGFVSEDALIIKAQVQILRARADRPFRCLDVQYRRELLRVYSGNVAQICCAYVEEKRGKLVDLLEDNERWPSFVSFWLNLDQDSKDFLSKERADAVLAMAVKEFFVEGEVSSTLLMDTLCSGLKALEDHAAANGSYGEEEEDYAFPMINMEDGAFVLMDDALQILEMAAMEADLPSVDKEGPQNRNKAVDVGEAYERRLTELGRRTIEIFVLTHIFGKIEITYQELVALRMQEELIEEEAALIARNEKKGKRGASEKEKKSKKKQDKKKRNNRKEKDKGKEDKSRKNEQQSIITSPVEEEQLLVPETENAVKKSDEAENISEANGSLNRAPEVVRTDAKEAEAEIAQPDSSFSEVVRRKPQNGKNRKSSSRGKKQQSYKVSDSADWQTVGTRRASKAAVSSSRDTIVEKEEKSAISSSTEPINVDVTSPTKSGSKSRAHDEASSVVIRSSSKGSLKQADRSPPSPPDSSQGSIKLAQQEPAVQEPIEKSADEEPQVQPVVAEPDEPLSAPITSGPRPIEPSVPAVQSSPLLARLEWEAAAFGGPSTWNEPTSSMTKGYLSYAQATSLAGSPTMHPHVSDRIDSYPIVPSFDHQHQWDDNDMRDLTEDLDSNPNGITDLQSFDPRDPLGLTRPHRDWAFEFSAGPQGHTVAEEFPHIDIINELFDDDYGFGCLSSVSGLGDSRGPGDGLRRPGPSTGLARFTRTRGNGLQHGYGGSGRSYDMITPFGPPRQPGNGPNSSGYSVINRWQPTNRESPSHWMNEGDNWYVFGPLANGL